MKGITKFISLLYFILLIGIINAQNSQNENNSKNNNLPTNSTDAPDTTKVSNNFNIEDYLNKPSKAFTAVLMVYMALIIIGAVLVLVLVKPKIDN